MISIHKFKTAVFAVFATMSATVAVAESKVQFMPDNDLWKEDSMELLSSMTETKFNEIIDAATNAFATLASQNNETLIINRRWTDSTVNANCLRSGGRVTINMYGGLARRQEVNADAFALVVCHELGHAYGGTPLLQVSSKMSAEGQADYYGAQTCLRKVLPNAVADADLSASSYITKICNTTFAGNSAKIQICTRSLVAGQGLGNLLATLSQETTPDYETPDRTVVSKTMLSYPDTVQCRVDTYHNGALGLIRPACWFRQ